MHKIKIFFLSLTSIVFFSIFVISCSDPINQNNNEKPVPAVPDDVAPTVPEDSNIKNPDKQDEIETDNPSIPLWEKGYKEPFVKQIEEEGGSSITSFTQEDITILSNLVGQASSKIAEMFPKTFGYLKDANVGIGLSGGRNKDDGSRALVVIGVGNSKYQIPPTWEYVSEVFTRLTLDLRLDIALPGVAGGNPIAGNDKAIKELEYLMSHEIMHAIMGAAFSMGMTSFHIDGISRAPDSMFPIWFREGTAVATGGLINGDLGSMLATHDLNNSDLNAIVKKLNEYSISADGEVASYTPYAYASGYLACMYIGYIVSEYQANKSFNPKSIANESNVTINIDKIREGLDLYMATVAQGYSLTDALNKLTGTSYNNFDEFEADFPSIPVAAFSKALNKEIGNGAGSLLNKSLSDKTFDFYNINESLPYAPLKLIPSTINANTYYNNDIVVVKGGGKDSTGYSRHGSYPADASKPPYGYDPLGTTPYVFKPYMLLTDTTITVTLNDINQNNLNESKYSVAIKENNSSRNILNGNNAVKINNVSWYKGNDVTGTPLTSISENGTYTVKIELEGKGFINENSATDSSKKYPLYGRFIGTNNVILNYNGQTDNATVTSSSPFDSKINDSLSSFADSSFKVTLKDNGTKIVITKTVAL